MAPPATPQLRRFSEPPPVQTPRRAIPDAPGARRRPNIFLAIIGVLGELSLTAAVLVALFAGWQVFWTDIEANNQQATEVTQLAHDIDTWAASSSTPDAQQAIPNPTLGQAYALIRIPRFGVDYVRPTLEGTDHDILARGFGHYPTTAQPGQIGNASFAGHRTTYGRPLWDIDLLQPGDAIIIQTKQGVFLYRVTGHQIVNPTDSSVISAVPGQPGATPTQAQLTFTSCHPKYSARERYIVHALLEQTYPTLAQIPDPILRGQEQP